MLVLPGRASRKFGGLPRANAAAVDCSRGLDRPASLHQALELFSGLGLATAHPASLPDRLERSGPNYRACAALVQRHRRCFHRKRLPRPARHPKPPRRLRGLTAGEPVPDHWRGLRFHCRGLPVIDHFLPFAFTFLGAVPRVGAGRSRGSTASAAAMSLSRSRHDEISLPVTGLSNGSMRLNIGAGRSDRAGRARPPSADPLGTTRPFRNT